MLPLKNGLKEFRVGPISWQRLLSCSVQRHAERAEPRVQRVPLPQSSALDKFFHIHPVQEKRKREALASTQRKKIGGRENRKENKVLSTLQGEKMKNWEAEAQREGKRN